MKIAIITVAGVSSRFNQGVAEDNVILKAIYYDGRQEDTLLYHMVSRFSFVDRIIVVGGFQFDRLSQYVERFLPDAIKRKITLVYNDHFEDYSSGYSLHLGVSEAFKTDPSEIEDIFFAEGDLDVDDEAVSKIAQSEKTVLTYNNELIQSNKAVVLYLDEERKYKYAFNTQHGPLMISGPFYSIYNSGQIWKFHDAFRLSKANDLFCKDDLQNETTLCIVRHYLSDLDETEIELIGFDKWCNCNTRDDYMTIRKGWEEA